MLLSKTGEKPQNEDFFFCLHREEKYVLSASRTLKRTTTDTMVFLTKDLYPFCMSIRTLLLAIPFLAMGVAHAAFSDTWGHPNQTAIEYVQSEGIVEGYPDGTYKPDQTINRAEFTKIIVGATSGPQYAHTTSCFSDIPSDQWFTPYVCFAKEHGIIEGYPDGLFRPANTINLAEAAKIVVESFEIPPVETSSQQPWFLQYLLALQSVRAMPGNVTGPDMALTRGQMAEIIYRVHTANIPVASPTQTTHQKTQALQECTVTVEQKQMLCPFKEIEAEEGILFAHFRSLKIVSLPDKKESTILNVPSPYIVMQNSLSPDRSHILLTMKNVDCGQQLACSWGRAQVWMASVVEDATYGTVYQVDNLAPTYGRNADVHGWTSWATNKHAFFNAYIVDDAEKLFGKGTVNSQPYIIHVEGNTDYSVSLWGGDDMRDEDCLTGRVFPSGQQNSDTCIDGQRITLARRCDYFTDEADFAAFNTDHDGQTCVEQHGQASNVPVLKIYAYEVDTDCQPTETFDAFRPATEPRKDGIYAHMGLGPEWGDMQPTISPDGTYLAYMTRKGFDLSDPDDACEAFNDPRLGDGKGDGAPRITICTLNDNLQCDETYQLTTQGLEEADRQGQPFIRQTTVNGSVQTEVIVTERRHINGKDTQVITLYPISGNEAGEELTRIGFGGYPFYRK